MMVAGTTRNGPHWTLRIRRSNVRITRDSRGCANQPRTEFVSTRARACHTNCAAISIAVHAAVRDISRNILRQFTHAFDD